MPPAFSAPIGVGDNEAVEACLLLLGAEGGDGGVGFGAFGAVGLCGCRKGCGAPRVATSVAAVPRLSAVRATPRAEG